MATLVKCSIKIMKLRSLLNIVLMTSLVVASRNTRRHSSSSHDSTQSMLHCSNEAIFVGSTTHTLTAAATSNSTSTDTHNIDDDDDNDDEHDAWWTTQLRMSLNETACFVVKDSIVDGSGGVRSRHTIKYARMEHQYAINGFYTFAIPLVRPTCKCDCAGGETICSVDEFYYQNCTTSDSDICYRKHVAHQSRVGCATSGASEVCCEMRVEPHDERRFRAIQLGQPSTFVVLVYTIYIQQSDGRWRAQPTTRRELRVPMDTGAAIFNLDDHDVRLQASAGPPHRLVESGMYFYEQSEQQLRGGVALNEPEDGDLNRLGWFRRVDGRWTVRQGLEKLTPALNVVVRDCKAQRYRMSLIAEHFVLKSSGVDGARIETRSFQLGRPTADARWVGGIEIGEREVTIAHAEGAELALHIRTRARPVLILHKSALGGFNGSIYADADGRRLNLQLYDVRGTILGEVYRDTIADPDAVQSMFAVHTGDETAAISIHNIPLSADVGGSRLVCVHPNGTRNGDFCAIFRFEASPLVETRVASWAWMNAHSECVGCNERGVDGFMARFDPRLWLATGLQTPTDAFVILIEVGLCIGALLASIIICTKCVIPLCRCLVCVAKPLRTSSSRTKSSLQLIEKF